MSPAEEKDPTRKPLELIHTFLQNCRIQIYIQKSAAFLYTSNELTKREIKEMIQISIASKSIKYIGINLHKEEKELHFENYDTDERNWRWHKWKDTLCSWIGRINTVKIITWSNAIPTKYSMAFFTELEQKIFKFVWKHKRPPSSQNHLKKEEKSDSLTSDYATNL